jgi:hypothetical protein
MAVVTQVQYLPHYVTTQSGPSANRMNESSKFANGGIFAPNNGNQTTTGGSLAADLNRLALAGLQKSGSATPPANTQPPSVQFGGSDDSGNDWRVRVSVSPNSKILYWDPTAQGNVPGLLSPLKATDGVIFPYVPSVTVSHSANYSAVPLTHSNYTQYFYESSAVAAISISADFTVQNSDEAKYFLAAIYFFRACTKMFYGFSGEYQGSPPPIVYLDGYGAHYLPHVPCVVTGFTHTMPADVDYMEVNTPQSIETTPSPGMTKGSAASGGVGINVFGTGKSATAGSPPDIVTQTLNTAFNRVPTASTFNITLQPIYSRIQGREFSYSDFAKGGLIGNQSTQLFPGGFI